MPPPMVYYEIADDLARRIHGGEFPPDPKGRRRLPSYPALATEYEVSRSTIARAIDKLKGDGYAVGRPGEAVYIADHLPPKKG